MDYKKESVIIHDMIHQSKYAYIIWFILHYFFYITDQCYLIDFKIPLILLNIILLILHGL